MFQNLFFCLRICVHLNAILDLTQFSCLGKFAKKICSRLRQMANKGEDKIDGFKGCHNIKQNDTQPNDAWQSGVS